MLSSYTPRGPPCVAPMFFPDADPVSGLRIGSLTPGSRGSLRFPCLTHFSQKKAALGLQTQSGFCTKEKSPMALSVSHSVALVERLCCASV